MALTLDNILNKDEIKAAIESGDSEKFAEAVIENIVKNNDALQKKIIAEAKNFSVENADATILAQRGFKPLTAEELKYYNNVADAHSFNGLPLPKSVFERVFDDLVKEHPLLSKINFQNVTGTSEWIIRTGEIENAWWGPLCEEIKKKLDTAFTVVNVNLLKVSAYIPVCKGMLDLGPMWLDKYVRTVLGEAIALAFEKGIIAGTGKDEPIGIIKQLENVSEGVHQDKVAVKLTDFSTATIGSKILAPLRAGRTTPMKEILLIVNETAYYEKIFPIVWVQDQHGLYHKQDLPFNGTIIPSPYVPVNRMVVGEAQNYFLGVGSTLKIEHSDEFRFLDDQRVYIAKQYANGRPRKDTDFIVFDIENLELLPKTVPGA